MNTWEFLSVREAAQRLGVSLSVVYRLLKNGHLAHYRITGAIKIAPTDLAAYIERHRVEAQPRAEVPFPKAKYLPPTVLSPTRP